MDEHASPIYRPVHKICSTNVATPKLCVDETGTVCVQWFGEKDEPSPSNAVIPENSQFLFAVMNSFQDLGAPEDHMVIFLGQAKNWLSPKAIQAMINGPGEGCPNTWLIWMINPKLPGQRGPCSPCIKIALLGDPNCGVITPKHFSDLKVRDEAMRLFDANKANALTEL